MDMGRLPARRYPTTAVSADLAARSDCATLRSDRRFAMDSTNVRAPGPRGREAQRSAMPEKATVARAKQALRKGKQPTTAAGEFVREEIEHVRRGKHGARSPQQAIAIGLSKARRAGIPLPPPGPGRAQPRTRRSAQRAYEVGQGKRSPRSPSRRRSQAISSAIQRESRQAASAKSLSAQSKKAAARRRRSSRARA